MMAGTINKELRHIANNYKSLPISIRRGNGIYLEDSYGRKYMDFIGGYSAVNQGHCHPKIVGELKKQASKLTICSRAFHSEMLAEYGAFMTNRFNYEKILPTNTGVEAVETGMKIARSWGYNKKYIDKGKAKIIVANNNFGGRTITAVSASTDPTAYEDYGPRTPGFIKVPYNNIDALIDVLSGEEEDNICAIMIEPIQGEGGIIVPDEDYLFNVRRLCTMFNILFICDEVQTGLGRTGKLYESDNSTTKPDVLLLGKSLSGGMFPISAVLANKSVMNVIKPGTHGSTFGGSALSSVVARKSVDVLIRENMITNSKKMGHLFRKGLSHTDNMVVKEVRGKGLMNGVEFYREELADKFIMKLMENGILTKSTKSTVVRFTPPLVITAEEINKSVDIIYKCIREL